MQIINCGRGVHAREAKGIGRLKSLPNGWYAFTNLDLATGIGRSREIDVIMVSEDRIFLIDLKDWHGKIESREGNWFHNGRDTGPSPVGKIHGNVKDVLRLLTNQLRSRPESKTSQIPKLIGVVVITGKADLAGIAATERNSVFAIEDFIGGLSTDKVRRQTFGNIPPQFLSDPLTSSEWKDRLSKFFNARVGHFKPGKRRYDRYVASSDEASFAHPTDIFREYEAEEEGTPQSLGTLRIWDFTKCADTRFQTEEGRAEIAGRERKIFYYLRDRNDQFESSILVPKAADPDLGVGFWEIYDRRRRLKRLSEFVATEAVHLSNHDRIELARQTIGKVAALHAAEAAHLDLGSHSVWLESPSTVRLSHLMAAKVSEVSSLGEARYQFLSSVTVPETLLGNDFGAKRRDVFLTGVVVHQILYGRAPDRHSDQDPPEWDPSVDGDRAFENLHSWFERALELDPAGRFDDAGTALEAFNAAIASRPTVKEVIEGLEGFRTEVCSQRQLFNAYPEIEVLHESDRAELWKSERDGVPVLVKMWKRDAWGDQTREGPRILDFLMHVRELKLSPPSGCAVIRDVMWLGDAIVLIQEWIEGDSLSKSLASGGDFWRDETTSLTFLESVRKVQAGLLSFLTMSRIEARRKNASAFPFRHSQSLASLRHLPSHAKVRSTTQRLGTSTKPFAASERLTISTLTLATTSFNAFANIGP